MNSSQLLERNARKYPNAEAVICMGRRITYEQLNEHVNQFAHALKGEGIHSGDKVILFLPNVADFVIAYFAIQRIGAIVVPISAKLTLPEVEYIIKHSDAKAFITHDMLLTVVKTLEFPSLRIKTGEEVDSWRSFESLLQSGEKAAIPCLLKDGDESTILYTSGTTGQPKGVLFSYRNILTVHK